MTGMLQRKPWQRKPMEFKVGGTKRRHQKCGWQNMTNWLFSRSLFSCSDVYWSKLSPLPSPYHHCPQTQRQNVLPADSLDTPTPLPPLWCPKRCQQDIDVEGWNPRCKRQEQDRQYNQFHRDHLERSQQTHQSWMLVRLVQGRFLEMREKTLKTTEICTNWSQNNTFGMMNEKGEISSQCSYSRPPGLLLKKGMRQFCHTTNTIHSQRKIDERVRHVWHVILGKFDFK